LQEKLDENDSLAKALRETLEDLKKALKDGAELIDSETCVPKCLGSDLNWRRIREKISRFKNIPSDGS